jgi:hypothetical protein
MLRRMSESKRNLVERGTIYSRITGERLERLAYMLLRSATQDGPKYFQLGNPTKALF